MCPCGAESSWPTWWVTLFMFDLCNCMLLSNGDPICMPRLGMSMCVHKLCNGHSQSSGVALLAPSCALALSVRLKQPGLLPPCVCGLPRPLTVHHVGLCKQGKLAAVGPPSAHQLIISPPWLQIVSWCYATVSFTGYWAFGNGEWA